MRAYEIMFVVRPDLEQEKFEAVIQRYADQINTGGGQVEKTDVWGKRRLAYPIKHFEEGFYVLVNFSADVPVIDELDRTMSISDEIIRFKILRRVA